MCSINGFNFNDKELIQKMDKVTDYRGPDASGFFVDNNISLGHNRLSIIDLSENGNQPMSSRDSNLVIIFNGEIYNYKQLKKELNDYDYKSDSDTEVILAAYQKWGKDCVKKFNGIFAFAIWDKKNKELFAARDHLGVKPFFYFWDGDKFIFSSEIKGILEHPIKKKLNPYGFNAFFKFLYINGPETIWENIYQLPPASYLILKDKDLRIEKYWQIDDYSNLSCSEKEIKKIIRKTLKDSVRRQMIADVPVGLFLSGGLDSTIILGLMKELTDKKIKTFSVGYEVKDQREKFNTDMELAQKTARHYGTDHHEILVSSDDFLGHLEKVIWHMDNPVANPTQVSMYMLSQLARENGIKVVLGGDGGDELFGGYDRYYYYRQIEKWRYIPRVLRKNFLVKWLFKKIGQENIYQKLNLESDVDIFLAFRAQKDSQLKRFLIKRFLKSKKDKKAFADDRQQMLNGFNLEKIKTDLPKRLMKADIDTWLVNHSLAQTDKMTMAHGVEQRVPILDYKMVELAMKVPTKYKLESAKQGKKIFKEAFREYIPDFIYHKEKTGWFSPTAKWLRTGLKDLAYEVLSEDYNPKTKNFFDFEEIKIILDKHIDHSHYALNTIWSLIVFQIWYKQYSK